MKILYICTAFPRNEKDPITPWLVETIKRLRERGFEIEVFTSSYKGIKQRRLFSIPICRFRYSFKRFEHLTHDQAVVERLKQGFKFKILVIFYLLSGFLHGFLMSLRKKYDWIHVHWPFPHGLFSIPFKIFGRSRVVYTFHGAELILAEKSIFYKFFLRFINRFAEAITVNSSFTRKKVLKITSDKPVYIVPFGAAVEPKEVRNEIGREKEEKRILFVGRLVERKGVKYLIEAIKLLAEKYKNLKLIIVGIGPDFEYLKHYVKSSDMEKVVVFKGRISSEELMEEYRNSDVFVLPAIIDSKGDTEGLGVVLIEAMSFGVPVVASRVGGIVDVVLHEETGLLVEEKNVEELRDSIERLLVDKELKMKLIRNAYQHINKNFNWDSILDKLVTIYTTSL